MSNLRPLSAVSRGNDELPGWKQDQRYSTVLGALPAGGNFSLPGPAAGNLRFYDNLFIVANVVAAGLTSVVLTLQPTGQQLQATASTTATASLSVPSIGFGETLRIANGGANPGVVSATYYDLPVGNYTLIRATINKAIADGVGVVIVPAPGPGLIRRLAFTTGTNASGTRSMLWRGTVWFNEDTISHQVETLLGGTLLGRTTSFSTKTVGNLVAPSLSVTAASGSLTVRTLVASSTTPPTYCGLYETLAA